MRPEKASIIEDIQGRLNESPFLLVVNYQGLDVRQFAELRNRLTGVQSACHVVKNTLLRRAAKEIGLPDFSDELTGQNAIVLGEKDVSAASKILKNFAAEFNNRPVVKTGVLDGRVLSSDEIQMLADLPTREVLLAQLLGAFQAPAAKLVRLLNEPGAQLARILQAYGEKKGSESPSAPASEPAAAEPEAPAAEATATEAPAAADTPAPAAAEETPAPAEGESAPAAAAE